MSDDDRDLLALAHRVVERAVDGEDVEAYAVRSVDTEVEVREEAVESLSSAQTRGVGVRVIADGRQGYASTAVVDDDGLAAALEEARGNAAVAAPDEANVLPEARPVPEVEGIADPAFDEVTVEDRVGTALAVEAAARETDERVTGVESVRYADSRAEIALASSRGMSLIQTRTDAYAYAFVLAEDGGETQTGFGITVGRGAGDLDPAAAGGEAGTKAVRLLGASKPTSRRTPVVFDPYVTAQFLGVLARALDAEAVMKGRSLFAGRLGEEVALASTDLVDDGLYPGAPGTGPWDAEGVPRQRTAVIEEGRLSSYLHTTWTARRLGEGASTGNASRGGFRSSPSVAPTNLFLVPGETAPGELLADVDEGVYVQDVMGLHSGANPVSGEFSVSFSGLEITDGELAAPIREAAVSSTLLDVLGDIRAVADDLRFIPVAGSVGGATMLIGEMSVSGS